MIQLLTALQLFASTSFGAPIDPIKQLYCPTQDEKTGEEINYAGDSESFSPISSSTINVGPLWAVVKSSSFENIQELPSEYWSVGTGTNTVVFVNLNYTGRERKENRNGIRGFAQCSTLFVLPDQAAPGIHLLDDCGTAISEKYLEYSGSRRMAPFDYQDLDNDGKKEIVFNIYRRYSWWLEVFGQSNSTWARKWTGCMGGD